MITKPVTDMSYQEWLQKDNNKFWKTADDLLRDGHTTEAVDEKLRKAVAYYLYMESKEEPGAEGDLYSAAALALIGETVDPELLEIAEEKRSNEDPLSSKDFWESIAPEIEQVWRYHHRVEIEAAERAYDAAHTKELNLETATIPPSSDSEPLQ